MKNLFNSVFVLCLFTIGFLTSCEIFGDDEMPMDMPTENLCNLMIIDEEEVELEFLQKSNRGPTHLCNQNVDLVFFNGFEDFRGTSNGASLTSSGYGLAISLRTPNETMIPDGTYEFSDDDLAMTIKKIEYIHLNPSLNQTSFLDGISGTLTISTAGSDRNYNLEVSLEDQSTLSICFEGNIDAEVVLPNPNIECRPVDEATYLGQALNLTKGYWKKSSFSDQNNPNTPFDIILCSEDISYNTEDEKLEGQGNAIRLIVYLNDDALPQSEDFTFWNDNSSNLPGLISPLTLFVDYNFTDVTGNVDLVELERISDAVRIYRFCDTFKITILAGEEFNEFACFAGDLIEIVE